MHILLLIFLCITSTVIGNENEPTEPQKKEPQPAQSQPSEKKRKRKIIAGLVGRAGRIIPRRRSYVRV